MSSLSIFPTEILGCITGAVTTCQQVRLWQCGDRILNYKLKNGGLKRTSLCWSGSSWMPWPRWYFTTIDGLVDVEWGMGIGVSLCPTLDLNILPKTLKRIRLDCNDVYLLLRNQNINMNDILPYLHTLSLYGSRLCEENLKNLPSNLIELAVTSNERIESSTIFGDLPRTIQRLTAAFRIVDQSEHENDLPSGLISLDIHGIESNFNWFSKLPKSLLSLKIGNGKFDPDWSTLPPQLETLQLFSSLSSLHPPMSSLPQLPRPLKDLECFKFRNDVADTELVPLLPKNLTRMKVGLGLISHTALKKVPVSLTDFDVLVIAANPDVLSVYHPDTIRMRLRLGQFSEQLSNTFHFPTKLQHLSLDTINDDICAMLPSGLRSIYIHAGLITTKGASKFPMSLSSLKTCFEVFDNNEAMSCLRQVTNISLWAQQPTPRNLNEKWLLSLLPSSTIQNSNDQSLSDSAYLNDANQHLTSLSIHGDERWKSNISPYVQKSLFDALPKLKGLSTLDIKLFGGIHGDWLCLIPKNVKSLSIGFLDTYPTANQLLALPRCLIDLSLAVIGKEDAECDWNDETLQSLPRSLQRFYINGFFPNVTPRMYEYLPPTLLETSLNSRRGVSFGTPLDRLYGQR